MSDPRRYSLSIIENYTDKSLNDIALAVLKKIESEVSSDDFTLEDVEDLTLGVNFLTTEDPYTWRNIIEDLAPVFVDFPDTCFCLSVSDGEDGGQYRILFFNGKAVEQYPEIIYEQFHPNDFEYQTSSKEALPTITAKLKSLKVREVTSIEDYQVSQRVLELMGMIDPSQPIANIEMASVASADDSETREIIRELLVADDVSPKQGNLAETLRQITNPQINTDNLKKVVDGIDKRIERFFGSRQDA